MGVFKCACQLWKSLKNCFYHVLRPRTGQVGVWRLPGGWPGNLGRHPGHLGASSEITWGFSRCRKAQSEDPWRCCDHLEGSSERLGGPWEEPKKLCPSFIRIRERVLIGPGPP